MKRWICVLCALTLLWGACAAAELKQTVHVTGEATDGAAFTVTDARYVPVKQAVMLTVSAVPADEDVVLIDAQMEPEPDDFAQAFDGTWLGLACDLEELTDETGERFWMSYLIDPQRADRGLSYRFTVNLKRDRVSSTANLAISCALKESTDGQNIERITNAQTLSLTLPLQAALAEQAVAQSALIAATFSVSDAICDEAAKQLTVWVDVVPDDIACALADLELGLMEQPVEALRKETLRYGMEDIGVMCDVLDLCDAAGESVYGQFSQACVRHGRSLSYRLTFDLKRPLAGETICLTLIAGVNDDLTKDGAQIQHIDVAIPVP